MSKDEKELSRLFWIDSADDHIFIQRECYICSAKVNYPFKEKNVKMLKARSCVCPSCRNKMKTDTGKCNDKT